MILHIVEGADGTRHIHAAGCGHIVFQLEAGEVDEIEIDAAAEYDEVLLAIWDDVLDPDLADDEIFDEHDEQTFYYRCARDLLGLEEEETGVPVESSGNDKADDFMDEAEDAGWAVEFITDDEYVVVKAKREFVDLGSGLRCDELLELSWSPTRLVDAHHVSGLPGDVAKRLSSVKGAIALLHSQAPRSKAKTNGRQVDREEPVKRILKEDLPFDIENAYDDEIIEAVQGRYLIWWNNTSEDYEKHFCLKQKNHIRIETGQAGRAILTFISPEGFRSVALEELVRVK